MESPLQGLIEFLMANVWLVIIVLGFIANTFRRFSSGESEPTTPVPMPKQFNPFDQEPKPDKEEYQVETKYDAKDSEELSDTQVPNTFYERYQELQEKGIYSEPIKEEKEPALSVIKQSASTGSKEVKSFSKNKVVEGIIWSEILGPPRAKKPYQIRR
ncbi:hypothetical protein [Bacillus sinesaloumensis]|uniref:hypothetical protein n=1 Tax=Litchfieldia sinesaloumensis TaxID=1926280 RepID=UPI0009884C44|nr:hypothetical protein [Bacillus sinesaloumensis]